MAYYSGTANSLANLLTALTTHAVADGWTLTGDVLSKAGVYFQLQTTATNLTCLGCESNAVANPAPNVVSIGRIWERTGYTTREITFPCNYEVFGFADEIFLVVNYDVDSYQWMAFGKSSVPGIIGQGGWCGASIGAFSMASQGTNPVKITSSVSGAEGYGFEWTCAALFWRSGSDSGGGGYVRNAWINHGLDSHGWTDYGAATDVVYQIDPLTKLLDILPNAWNSESVLLPIRCWKRRPSYKTSLVLDVANARIMRLDNLSPGDILTLGSDKWKVFPWYRKDAAARNGGQDLNHTGTFGWAIRYQGP